MKRLMGEFPSVMRVDLRPRAESSLTWSGRRRKEGKMGGEREEEGGEREERCRGRKKGGGRCRGRKENIRYAHRPDVQSSNGTHDYS